MAAGGDAVAIDARTCTDTANMGAGPDAGLANMRADPHTQNINARAKSVSGYGGKKAQRQEHCRVYFHLWSNRRYPHANGQRRLAFQ